MSHPTLWSKGLFFYPIGNTPAVDLLQDLPLEENANILLLGCGDPRSILFTIYNSSIKGVRQSKLDLTCCDIEPAVLARNALLFTLIVEECPIEQLWDIFYHFKIDATSYSTLCCHCDKLAQCSETLEDWHKSPYSTFLRICNRHTLSQLHHHWKYYTDSRNFSAQQIRKWESQLASVKSLMVSRGWNNSAARAAGLFTNEAREPLSSNFEHYWETGVVDTDPRRVREAKNLNPTFTRSERFEFHYGIYPLGGFLLSEAFCSGGWKVVDLDSLIRCAKGQFESWCAAFRQAVTLPEVDVVIRLFAGDAISFCHALYALREKNIANSSLFVSTWSLTELILDGGDCPLNTSPRAPMSFNVIDTSNIADHIGLWNTIISAVPLLSPIPTATLYTDSLAIYAEDASSSFLEQLLLGIPTFSILLGIAPASYLSQFTTRSNIHELLFMDTSQRLQYHERIAWKAPNTLFTSSSALDLDHTLLGDSQPHLDPHDLAQVIFKVYEKMFEALEDPMSRLRGTIHTRMDFGVVHYHRGTLSALIGLIKRNIRTDWSAFMDAIFYLLHNERRLQLNSNFYQELCCQLHIHGIFSVETLRPNQSLVFCDKSKGPFKGWSDVPPIVCVVFVIPRSKLRPLLDLEQSNPMLEISFRSAMTHNIFSCVKFTFGKVVSAGSGERLRLEIEEDRRGWEGSADMIASCWIPSATFTGQPSNADISLGLYCSPQASIKFTRTLGPFLHLFTTSLADRKSVYFVKERPGNPTELDTFRALAPDHPKPISAQSVKISVDIDKAANAVSELRARITVIPGTGEGKALLDGADIQTHFNGVSALRVTFGRFHRDIILPFPIDNTAFKVLIARKSGYIEIVAPPARPGVPSGFSARNISTIGSSHIEAPIAWNFHRISIPNSPIFLRRSSDLQKLILHLHFAHSRRERTEKKSRPTKGPAGTLDRAFLLNIKTTIGGLFSALYQHPEIHIFVLEDVDLGPYCVLFAHDMRLDLPNYTLFVDCSLLPLTRENTDVVMHDISSLDNTDTIAISTTGDATIAWKYLLPAFVERCRSWSHKEACEYRKNGMSHIPVSSKHGESPLCSCGSGIDADVSKFPWDERWARCATRAAISPLYALSYLEPVMEDAAQTSDSLMDRLGQLGVSEKACKKCGKEGSAGTPLLTCARCKVIKYCGPQCQRDDWKDHKGMCKTIKLR